MDAQDGLYNSIIYHFIYFFFIFQCKIIGRNGKFAQAFNAASFISLKWIYCLRIIMQ